MTIGAGVNPVNVIIQITKDIQKKVQNPSELKNKTEKKNTI